MRFGSFSQPDLAGLARKRDEHSQRHFGTRAAIVGQGSEIGKVQPIAFLVPVYGQAFLGVLGSDDGVQTIVLPHKSLVAPVKIEMTGKAQLASPAGIIAVKPDSIDLPSLDAKFGLPASDWFFMVINAGNGPIGPAALLSQDRSGEPSNDRPSNG